MSSFNWRNYIEIFDKEIGTIDGRKAEKHSHSMSIKQELASFSQENVAFIVYALDTIAAAVPDGPELLKMAAVNSPHHKLKILPSVTGSSGGKHPGVVALDIQQINMLCVMDFDKKKITEKRVSLTGVLVHELFHVADFNNCPEFSKKLSTYKSERDAVHYTDMFMAKHFPGEPWREFFGNSSRERGLPLMEKQLNNIIATSLKVMGGPVSAVADPVAVALQPSAILIAQPGCGTVKEGVYNPDEISVSNLGHFKQPSIAKTPSPFCKSKVGPSH